MRASRLFVFVALTVVSMTSGARAQETGLHKIHDVAMMGGKLCMTSHEHTGESLPSGTKGVAMATAIRHWARFTAEEYGKSWGSFALAVGKRESCKGSAPSIVCTVNARPCRGR